MLQQKY